MIRALAVVIAVMLPGLALADGWQVFGPDGSYQGRIERGGDGTLERFGADGSYQGRYDRGRDGWDAFGPDGAYQGRISGAGERGLPAVIGSKGARE
jgi:hypothetical protein